MGLYKFFHSISISSDALFRAYGKNISDGLQAVGLIKTSDTGQINWLTATRPSAGAWAGSEFFRMNDSLQSLYPSFFQIRYGISDVSALGFAIELTLGKGTTGSGALTGDTTTPIISQCYAPGADTAVYLNFVSGDADRFFIGCNVAAGNDKCHGLAMSRTRNADGSANNYAVNKYSFSRGKHRQQLLVNSVIGKYPTTPWTTLAAVAPAAAGTGSYAGEQGVWPIRPVRGYLDYTDLNGVFLGTGNLGLGQVFSTTLLGAVRKYIVIGQAGDTSHSNLAQHGLLCGRYE